MTDISSTRTQIEQMCVELGSNPLLVQGAGGNVSWKEKDILWIKASGTWLADAIDEDIFIPTNLSQIKTAISEGNFDITPTVESKSVMKPSIETLLHALMPHRIVIHLHAIDILSHLVTKDCELHFKNKLSEDLSYALVKYSKPGVDLARNVFQVIQSDHKINIVFLMNHGLVLGGESVSEILLILENLINRLKGEINSDNLKCSFVEDRNAIARLAKHGYVPAECVNFHELVINPNLSYLVENKWALFPDHVVFLGEKAMIGSSDNLDSMLMKENNAQPAFIFCKDIGAFQHVTASRAQIDQLKCFYDVAIRQNDPSKIVQLSGEDIKELLNWDAEKYRLSIAKL